MALKRPAFQFYPADWRKDVKLRACSIAARGLWIDLMCVAHECEPYGHLVLNGKPMTPQQISGQIGVATTMVRKLLDELIGTGVARVAQDGVIFSARMVRDEGVRNARADGGQAGADHGHKGASHGHKGGRPRKAKGGFETPDCPPVAQALKPPPSSSSSSSSTSSEKIQTRTSKKLKTPMPADFKISQRVTDWAASGGHADLDQHLDAFKEKCAAHGYTYVDWDAAFMAAVRADWARLRQPGSAAQRPVLHADELFTGGAA